MMEIISLIQGDENSGLIPFFLVHAISGVALPYLRLEALSEGDDRPVYGITSPIHCPSGENFRFPTSLAELAAIYLDGIMRIQPRGPYLLGGWSMGGMVAMFMAQILQARGQAVSKVIMIDSANPEVFPCFTNSQEHREFAKATYEKTIALAQLSFGNGDSSMSPIPSPVLSDNGFDECLLSRQRRASTWRTISSETSARSSSSSLFDSPVLTPASPDLSSISSDSSFEDGDDSDDLDDDCNSDIDEMAMPLEIRGFLGQIKLHIHRGLQLIADVRPGDLFTPGKRSNYDVVLIKCRPDTMLLRSHHHHHGAEFTRSVMRENSMRWSPSQFRSFKTVMFSGDHDGAFGPEYVGELSAILRGCLEDVD